MSNTFIAVLGISLTLVLSAGGASLVFFFKGKVSRSANSLFLGFASGVMVAASVWSLLLPAIESSESFGKLSFLPAAVGILAGGFLLVLLDKLLPEKMEDGVNEKKKYTKLFFAVTLHNIPEGLAVGLAFGGAFATGLKADFYAALGLAAGIGIQNIPEGTAISLPMKKLLNSRGKAFLMGTLSAVVEPVFALVGITLAMVLPCVMPWLLALAAGAMLLVVAENLLPEAVGESPHLGTWSFMLGFILMMVLDVALG